MSNSKVKLKFAGFEKRILMVLGRSDSALCLGRGEERDNRNGGTSQSFDKNSRAEMKRGTKGGKKTSNEIFLAAADWRHHLCHVDFNREVWSLHTSCSDQCGQLQSGQPRQLIKAKVANTIFAPGSAFKSRM